MKRLLAVAFALLAAASLSAKGRTVKITITGADLTAPIESTEENLGSFQVWAGPGVRINQVPQTEGFIIEWSRGVVPHAPAALQRYEVSFYAGCRTGDSGCKETEPRLAYVVSYAYDTSTEEGYVYLPGKADPQYRVNSSSIFRGGLEGNWFYSTSAWRKFMTPILARARR
ncbi:MAG: hypothetical protein HY013_07665 [Candidatus Solibacter usitatus]|nr:hypothetical protein [Candidatus Solibacter usitatus]